MNSINAYFPFYFSDKVDPRFVESVGEQIMVEHLFAFHARSSFKSGFQSVVSKIDFLYDKNLVHIQPNFEVKKANGEFVNIDDLKNSIESSFSDNRHAPYKSIIRQITADIKIGAIDLSFERIPLNLRFLFTVPDLSIFEMSDLPLTKENWQSATGPYSIKSVEKEKVSLIRNPNYPNQLVANDIEVANLVRYSPGDTKSFIRTMNPQEQHAAYFYGYAIDDSDIDFLKQNGYEVERFPTEWFVYGAVKPSVPKPIKAAFIWAINEFREQKLDKYSLSTKAYSIAPSDRPFMLNKEDYLSAIKEYDSTSNQNLEFTISTVESWSKIPLYKELLEFLKIKFPHLRVQIIQPADFSKINSDEVGVSLTLLGISPSDPLTHLSFLQSTFSGFQNILSKEDIAQLSIESNQNEFYRKVKEIEVRASQTGMVVPIAHFPGIVAHRKDFQRDENLAFGWGIQLWTFRVNTQH